MRERSMMASRRRFSILRALSLTGCLAGTLASGGPGAAQSPGPAQSPGTAVEPAAVALLKAAGDALAEARSLSFTATALHDVPNAEGQSIFYTLRSRVVLQRPDRLRVVTEGDGPASEFIADGRTLTLFNPHDRTVASAPAPGDLDAALKAEVEAAGQTQAFADMLMADPAKGLTEGLTRAFVVGRSNLVGGVETDIVAFAAKDAQAQIWIGVADRLPRQLWVTETTTAGPARNGVTFTDWTIGQPVPDRLFSTAHMAGARPIPFTKPRN
ncbi:DUF2092 domain-containing protein [Methylobacterium soli]|uniref:DUF2092 domain-containing protein n=2 Tax=Methylobacterium soli TaxID=553447 RepID=A0A6L3T565_9HYPH|nr:DUF2092 domain-containing protein [Methylobacterium soli]GJE45790.1 hypothetical protein AEGHOMDF_4990 [Methylobacterium soli]